MKRLGFKNLIFTLALIFLSTLFVVAGGVTLQGSKRAFVVADAAGGVTKINKVDLMNLSSSEFDISKPTFEMNATYSAEDANLIGFGDKSDSTSFSYRYKSFYRPAFLASGNNTFPEKGAEVSGSDSLVIFGLSDDEQFTAGFPHANITWSFGDRFKTLSQGLTPFQKNSSVTLSFGDVDFDNNFWNVANGKYKDCYFKPCVVYVCLGVEIETEPHLVGKQEPISITLKSISDSEAYKFSESKYAEAELSAATEDNLDETRTDNLYSCMGYVPTSTMPITVNYKEMTGYATYEDKSVTFTVSKYIFFNSAEVEKRLYAANLVKKTEGDTKYYFRTIADFNVNFFDSNGLIDGNKTDLSERIILQAESLDYTRNGLKGVISVRYSEFKYKDFFVKMTNNKPVTEDNLTAYLHTTNVTSGSEYTSMTYEYTTTENYLYNNYKWIVTLKPSNFTVGGTVTDKVEVVKNDRNIVIKFRNDSESLLATLKIIAVAEIEEDKEMNVYLKYNELVSKNNQFSFIEKEYSIGKIWHREVLSVYSDFSNVLEKFGAEYIYPALDIDGLNGVTYYKPVACETEYSTDDTSRVDIVVRYDHENVFYVVNAETGEGYFKEFLSGDTTCKGSYFGIKVPSGYRVESITTDYALITGSADDPLKQDFYFVPSLVAANESGIFEIRYVLTDEWKIRIEYLKDYTYVPDAGEYKGKLVKSGFAEKVKDTYKVKLSAFNDIYHPTEEELKAVMNVQSLTVIGELGKIVPFKDENGTIEKQGVKLSFVTFEDNVYYMTLNYFPTTIEVVQSTGQYEIISNVPLTNFGEWADDWGYDWSVMALNTQGNVIFKSQGDVSRYDLYGYFYVTVFKEQVKNLDSLFAGYSAEGCKTFYDYKEVQGSKLYKFLSSDNLGYVGTVLVGGVGSLYRATEETFNEQSGTYYSYFTYIDGTSSNPYAGNNKSDGFGDYDSAGKNTFDDVTENVKNTFLNLWNKIVSDKKITFLFWALIGLIGYAVLYKIFAFTGVLSQPVFKWIWYGITVVLLALALYFGLAAFGAFV